MNRIKTIIFKLLKKGLNCAALPIGSRICVPSVNNNNIINPQSACNTGFFYTIFSGDTCANIAGAFRITVAGLQQLNPSLNCASLPVGQRICVPRIGGLLKNSQPVPSVFVPSPNGCSNFFGTNTGDTCASIADILKTSVDALLKANPMLNCNKPLVTGLALCVPPLPTAQQTNESTSVGSCGSFYQIQSGDFCYNIAIKQGQMTLRDFLALNPGLNCDLLREGDKVCVRSGGGANGVGRRQCLFLSNYLVQRGDTCFALAARFRLELRLFTASLDCDHLQIGQQICI